MAGRKRTRDEAHAERRRAHYLQRLRDAPTVAGQLAVAVDYVRALLVESPPQVQHDFGKQAIGLLISVADAIDPPAQTRGDRRAVRASYRR
jgi:hypothetical protein